MNSKVKAIFLGCAAATFALGLSALGAAFLAIGFDINPMLALSLAAITSLAVATPAALLAQRSLEREIAAAHAELERLATHDSLTGLWNRRSMTERLDAELNRIERSDSPASLILIDIDHFHTVNQSFGQAAGDHALLEIGQLIESHFANGIDMVGRWGEDQFLLLLPETNLDGAITAGDRLREIVEIRSTEYNGDAIVLSISLGAAALAAGENVEAALERVESCLAAAKRGGRNRLVAARQSETKIRYA